VAQTRDPVTGAGTPSGPKPRGRFGLDLRPLRGSRDFRALFLAGLVGTIGAQGTYVVIPYQMKQLTGSLLDVGLLGAVEIVPLIVFGLLGGSLADTVDKRSLILWTELAMLCGTLALFANALAAHPSPLVLYAVAVVFASADGLQRPSLDALVPRLVAHDQLAAASSLSVFKWTFGSIIGPVAGGTLAVAIGPAAWYAVDAATFAFTLACYLTLARAPAAQAPAGRAGPGLRSVFEGVGYAVSRRDLLGTYLVDFTAMLFAFPVALFPFLAARYHESFALGLLYASLPVGALIASLASRWTEHVRRQGRGIVVAAVCWGLAVAAFGLSRSLWFAVAALVVAGGADATSGIFRMTMWNASIPDEVRGRMAGIELLSYSTGPELGQLRSALVAAATSLRTSVVSGGILCAAGCAALAVALPSMWRFDAATDGNVALVRAQREAGGAAGGDPA
jgi:MFS family permease